MSEEEKNFLENIKNILSDLEDTEDGAIISLNQEEIDSLKSIPKLIEKNQNKIASLEKQISLMQKDDRISKDKIREYKKWYEDACHFVPEKGIDMELYDQYQGVINFCEELLEE